MQNVVTTYLEVFFFFLEKKKSGVDIAAKIVKMSLIINKSRSTCVYYTIKMNKKKNK